MIHIHIASFLFLYLFTVCGTVEAFLWDFSNDDTQMSTVFTARDYGLSIWTESALSLVSKDLGSDPLDKSGHQSLVFEFLIFRCIWCICNLRPEHLELFWF